MIPINWINILEYTSILLKPNNYENWRNHNLGTQSGKSIQSIQNTAKTRHNSQMYQFLNISQEPNQSIQYTWKYLEIIETGENMS